MEVFGSWCFLEEMLYLADYSTHTFCKTEPVLVGLCGGGQRFHPHN